MLQKWKEAGLTAWSLGRDLGDLSSQRAGHHCRLLSRRHGLTSALSGPTGRAETESMGALTQEVTVGRRKQAGLEGGPTGLAGGRVCGDTGGPGSWVSGVAIACAGGSSQRSGLRKHVESECP